MTLAKRVLMVRPAAFGFNPEAAVSNVFGRSKGNVAEAGRREMEQVAAMLMQAGVEVVVVEDDVNLQLPDAVFPNNWFSTHPDGSLVLYPLQLASRRGERRPEILNRLWDLQRPVRQVDMTAWEEVGEACEGTGSLVFDHEQRLAFACLSSRTTRDVTEELCSILGYTPVFFEATLDGMPIYHSNVVLALGPGFAVLGKSLVLKGLEELLEALQGRVLIELSEDQVRNYAGNMLVLAGWSGPVTLISKRAFKTLTADQAGLLPSPVVVEIPTIELVGGGSARCMVAELF
jgi:hypothetical protein